MTPVLMAVCLLAGVLIGLRVNARRVATLREKLRLSDERHDAWNLSAKRTDLDEVGPVTRGAVELYDQDADTWDYVGIRSELPTPPPAMTGVRDTEAQDRELVDVFGIGEPAEHRCDNCSQPATVRTFPDGRRAPLCETCVARWWPELLPCVWSDGDTPCGDPSVGCVSWPGHDNAPLCALHFQWVREREDTAGVGE